MEAVNGWLSFPMHESLSHRRHDLPIRKFCPAARGGGGESCCSGEEEETSSDSVANDHQIELLLSPTPAATAEDTPPSPPPLPTSEMEEFEFVDSFFNLDYCSYDHTDDSTMFSGKKNHDDHNEFHHFHDQEDEHELLENLSSMMVEGDINVNIIPMMIEGDDDDDLDEIMMKTKDSARGVVNVPQRQTQTVVPMAEVVVDQGLQLVHLLLACAEAVGCRDTQLADSILGQIWPWVSPWGDSLQRVSYCFAMGLKSRLPSLLRNNLNANINGTTISRSSSRARSRSIEEDEEENKITNKMKTEAFQLLHQSTPYIAFGYMAANGAICHAAKGMDSLHIIDLGMQHTLQWPSFIRTLASRPEGPPKLLRITGLVGDHQNQNQNHQHLDQLQTNIKGLTDEAGSLGIPLEFHLITELSTTPPSLLLTKENLNLREEEALFVNSIMHLHKYVKESRGSLKTILQAIKKLGPTLLTVVEQDANHNGPFFLGRFLESLHYYSAIFDSLEVSLPRNSPQRMKIEKLHFAEEIRNIVAYEGSERIERHERADQWRRQLGRAGFQGVGMKYSMSQASMMLYVYGCDGYTLASDKGCLLLGWKGRSIMLASAWQVHNNVPKFMSN